MSLMILLVLAVPASAQLISFQPSMTEPVVPEFTVAIHLDTMGEVVQGLDIAFTYDPGIIRLDGIAPGYWFTGAVPDHYFWDYSMIPAGSGHFSAALLGSGSSNNGTVAILSFSALSAGISPLDFVTASCTIRDDENQDLTATTYTTGDFVRINPAVPAESRSFGYLKTLWR